jgi:acyl-CoA synthetase (NDP forming)/RimJ/RimL family protein N-acetyltransferase
VASVEPESVPYPAHWEADVVLRDGRTAHLRPITPEDAPLLLRFHSELSDQTIYYRFFAPYPQLTERDLARFTTVDHVDRVAIIATVGGEMVGVGRYDRITDDEAEVAFTIRDDHQGRGIGSVLLEHLAEAARERGLHRFVAEVLPTNRRMIGTFEEGGFAVAQHYEEGVVSLTFDLEPTERMRAVTEAREHRSEARSIERLLFPRSVVVVGASRREGTVGHEVLRHVVDGGFSGPLHAVHPEAHEILGVPCVRRITDVAGPVDLAVVVVKADTVPQVVADAAEARVGGLVVVSGGFADTGPEGLERQRALVAAAREGGMRVIGPNALGIINTDPRVSLNASLSPAMPHRGRVGFFAQSGAFGTAILRRAAARGLGMSTFVSAGNRADVSGNDLLQYWEEDEATSLVLLYLETTGNPRKFARVVRRLSRRKPVAAVRTFGASQVNPSGHAVHRTRLPSAAVSAVFRQSGVIEADTLDELFDVAGLLTFQPLPTGPELAVVGNSDALAVLARNAAEAAGLEIVGEPATLPRDASPADLAAHLAALRDDPAVAAILVLHVPPVESDDDSAVRAVLRDQARHATKPLLGVMVAQGDSDDLLVVPDQHGWPAHGSVPLFSDVEDAMHALARVARYAQWRQTPAGEVPEYEDIDSARARGLVDGWLAALDGDDAECSRERMRELLACFGIDLWSQREVSDADQAAAAAEELGWPAVLKTTVPALAHRTDLGGVRLNLESERAVRAAYRSMVAGLDPEAAAHLAVQRMAPPGVACVASVVEDNLFGPVVSFGVGGVVTELLRDRSYRLPPITDVDAAAMVREPGAAPLLFGHQGAAPVAEAALEDLLLRLGQVAIDLPEVAALELNPVVAHPGGVSVLDGRLVLRRPDPRTGLDARRLPG